MKFSVFTVGTPDLTIPETVSKLKKLGYHAVEWRVANQPQMKPNPIPPKESWYWTFNNSTLDLTNIEQEALKARELCDQVSLEICCLSTYLTPNQHQEIEQVLQAARSISCPKIRLMPPSYSSGKNYNELFLETLDHLAVLEKLARKCGVKIVLEIHHGNIIPSASAAYRLVSAFDSNHIGVIYDPGNMVHEGYEQYMLGVELLDQYIDHVHIKDARPQFDSASRSWEVQWCPVGEGVVDFPSLIAALRSIGYEGYLSSEDFSNEHDTDHKLSHNLKYLETLTRS